jgi:hypothetical protein
MKMEYFDSWNEAFKRVAVIRRIDGRMAAMKNFAMRKGADPA